MISLVSLNEQANLFNWSALLSEVIGEMKLVLNKENLGFATGYCFHLALALFLRGQKQHRNIIIIGLGTHVAVYDIDLDVVIDIGGAVGESEWTRFWGAPFQKWKTAKGLVRYAERLFRTSGSKGKVPTEELIKIFEHFK